MKRPDGVTVIAIWYFFVAVMSLLGLCTFVSLPLFGILSELDDAGLFGISAVIGTLGCFFLLQGILAAVTGYGLLKVQNWGRYLAIFLAVFTLFAFPVGTIIGAVILWYLFQSEVKRVFELGPEAAADEYADLSLDEIPEPDEDYEYKFYPPKDAEEAEEAEDEAPAAEVPAEPEEGEAPSEEPPAEGQEDQETGSE